MARDHATSGGPPSGSPRRRGERHNAPVGQRAQESKAMGNDQGVGYWVTRRGHLTPQRTALVFNEDTWTYGDLNRQTSSVAHGLAALGVCHGDRVAYLGLNHPRFLLTLFGAAKLGAIFVPLNFRLTAPELAFIIRDAGVHTLVYEAHFAQIVEAVRDEIRCHELVCGTPRDGSRTFDEFFHDAREDDLDSQVSPDEVAWIMYTSGTTGRPKGAMLTHGNLLWNLINASLAFDVRESDVTLVCAPLFHIGGLNVTPMGAFTKGATVILQQMFEPGTVLDNIQKHRVTTMFGVPAMFNFMAQHPDFASADLSSVRSFICGGAPVPEALIRLYGERGISFIQGYGLTETAPFASIVPADRALDKIGSAGIAPFFTDVRLVDDEDHPVAAGERGEICVRGPNVMKGYWNRPDATAEAIVNGWFHTGDVGIQDDEGYFYIVDRKKDMIISGGENVYPAEVEDVLYKHPKIAEVAVIGVPDAKWGETVRAIVVVKPDETLTEADVIEFVQDKLARYKQPKSVVFIDALPRNPAGKVLKFELREQHGSAVVTEAASASAPARP
jgi:fatty-acyl-CoA synthase